jgi:uncharacterized protein YecT (DUF1311 family)
MLAKLTVAAMVCACAIPMAYAQPTTVQPPQGLSPAYRACLDRAHRNTVQLGMCEQTEMAAQDARLNKAYQQVMRQLAKDPTKQIALRSQQRSWSAIIPARSITRRWTIAASSARRRRGPMNWSA